MKAIAIAWCRLNIVCGLTVFNLHTALADQPTTGALDEIVVTATKRNEGLSQAAVAISALDSKELTRQGVRDIGDLQQTIPSLTYSARANGGQTIIRGIGTEQSYAGLEPAVAIYLDQGYIQQQAGGILQAIDLKSIEVLKGPQGTLWGRNASGGAVLVNTMDPQPTKSGYLMAEYGNFDHQKGEFMFNLPVSDQLAIRLAGQYSQIDGYVNNVIRHDKMGGGYTRGLRFKALWRPLDFVEVVWMSQYDHNDGQNNILVAGDQAPLCAPCGIYGFKNPTGYYTASTNDPGYTSIESTVHNLRITADLDQYTFTSVTSDRDSHWILFTDQDYTQANFENIHAQEYGRTLTEELRLASKYAAPLNFLIGLNYEHDVTSFPVTIAGDVFGPLSPIFNSSTSKLNSLAPYAEAYYDLTDYLRFTAGARYTHDTKSFLSVNNANSDVIFGNTGYQKQQTYSDTTPHLVFQYHDAVSNYYLSYTKGFKDGGFNSPAFAITPTINSEHIKSVEIGAKNELLDGRLRTSVALFHYDYKDIQVQHVDIAQGGIVLQNAASATTKGIEADGTFAFTRSLSLSAGVTYLDAVYNSFPSAAILEPVPGGLGFQPVPGGVNLSGQQEPVSPKWSGYVSANVNYGLYGGWTGSTTATVRYTSRFDLIAGGGSTLDLDVRRATKLANLVSKFTSPNGKYEFGLYGRNLFNERYLEDHSTQTIGTLAEPAQPRTYGANVRINF